MNNMPIQQSSGAPTGDNPVLTYYREWCDRNPFVTRNVMVLLVICWIASFFFEADHVLGNTTFFTIFSFEVYRLILSPLVGNSILMLVLLVFFFPAMGAKMESSMGSSAFLFLMGTLALATNLLFCFVCMNLYFFGMTEAIFYDCSGFWLIVFGLITIESMQVMKSNLI